jgi:hypothetical protein
MLTNAKRSCWFVLLTAVLVASCRSMATTTREKELESVAKDWCMTIRASQVMPVYPLTQDIQPGDVFLVQLPIDKQQDAWREKGYLALDNHLARLNPGKYGDFYKNSFPLDPTGALPFAYLSAEPPWDIAPHAGFPTYSFSVKKGGGLNLALPVSGVPIGLGLLGADSAEGSISIGKARTLGIDIVSLDREVRDWARGDGRKFLAGLASSEKRKNYVRVVTRVYLTGELDVSLRDTSERSAGVDAGVPSPVATLIPKLPETPADTPQAALDNYNEGIDKLNGMLQKNEDRFTTDETGKRSFTPGGSLRLTSATARAISMKENFDPPLVIGYLGFDSEIGPGGELGPAVPTYAVVSGELGGEAFLAGTPLVKPYLDQFWVSSYQIARDAAAKDPEAQRVVTQCDALAQFVPSTWEFWQTGPGDGSTPVLQERTASPHPDATGYENFRQWRGNLETSSKSLSFALAHLPVTLERADGSTVVVAKNSPEASELAMRLANVQTQLDSALIESPHARARRELADWMFANLYAPRHD